MTDAQGDKFNVENHRRYFRSFSGKRNFAPSADDSDWYHIESVELHNGPANISEAGDNIGVVETWAPPAAQEINSQILANIKKEVAAGEWREHVLSPMWVGKAIATALDIDPDDQQDQLKEVVKALLKDGTLKRVQGRSHDHKPCMFIQLGDGPQEQAQPTRRQLKPRPRNSMLRVQVHPQNSCPKSRAKPHE